MKKILAALFVVALSFGSGCAALQSKLPVIIAAVMDGSLVLDAIESFVNTYFITHPNADKQKDVHAAIAKARAALDAALRIASGAEKLNQEKVDEAFADFRVFYTDVISLTSAMGVKTSGTKLAATPGGLTVPEPLAIKLKL